MAMALPESSYVRNSLWQNSWYVSDHCLKQNRKISLVLVVETALVIVVETALVLVVEAALVSGRSSVSQW